MDEKKQQMIRLVKMALSEDHVDADITTSSLAQYDGRAEARVIAKEAGVVSGIAPFTAVFLAIDRRTLVSVRIPDGSPVEPGARIATIQGKEGAILRAERTALNFLQHLSGVATLTRRFRERLEGLPVILLDTRKTTPGMRYLEKEAVLHGGGRNHRMNLEEMALVKENHIEMAGGIVPAVAAVRRSHPGKKIEVEVKDLAELESALALGVKMIMLDNFSTEKARKAVAAACGRAKLEISGNVTLENIREKAETGVDFISVGALTHSAPALDISLLLERQE